MEADRSIILQKKMVLFLSFIVLGIFSALVYIEKNNTKLKNVYAEKLDLITVNISEDEDEILRNKIKFLAVSSVETVESGEEQSFIEDIVPNDEEKEEVVVEPTIEEPKAEADTTLMPIITEQKTVKYRDLAENNPPEEYVNKIEVTATAYCLCKKCCGKTPDNPNYGCTHSGLKIVPGSGMKVIAVDPKIIPLNSKVYVEGLNGAWDYGHAVAADTGSAIKELKIDLYMDTHTEALEWGRRKVNVYVLGE
mgnify:FL=1